MSKPVYLGDSVYATSDGFMIRLYTDNGFGPSSEIYLEPNVYDSLVEYAKSVWTNSGAELEGADA